MFFRELVLVKPQVRLCPPAITAGLPNLNARLDKAVISTSRLEVRVLLPQFKGKGIEWP